MKVLALGLCLALVLPGCAEDKALIITGESLVSLGDQFVATAAAMDTALDAKAITPATYEKWKSFGLKFQQAYPLATELWRVASDSHDAKLEAQVIALVSQLALDLGAFAAVLGVK